MPRTYVDNAYNRSLGRVGMPHGSMPVSRGASGSSGFSFGSFGGSSGGFSTSSGKTYVDNAYNRSVGRVGMEYGTAVISKSSSSSNTYVDNAYNRSVGRVGMEYGTAVISKSSSSSNTYVDNAYNRSVGRVGMEYGTAVISKRSSSSYDKPSSSSLECFSFNSSGGFSAPSSTTYADNAYNRSAGRVGMEHGTAVVSKSSSSSYDRPSSSSHGGSLGGFSLSSSEGSSAPSSNTYADNAYNRSVGRVGMEHGTAVISKSSSHSAIRPSSSSSSSSDNSPRSHRRVGSPHGTAVISKNSLSRATPPPTSSQNTYVDNSLNRSLGRVGKPKGSMPHSRASASSSGSTKVYVDNKMNRALGRVGMPLGTMSVSKQTKLTRDNYQRQWRNQQQGEQHDDVYFDDSGLESDMEYTEESHSLANEIMNRLEHIKLWQQQSGTSRQPRTSEDILENYRGTRINFSEFELQKKIGHGGFGDVHFAKWNGTVVAVKKLRVQRVSKKRAREFYKETNLFCGLKHPNIVIFIGACVVTPNLCIVMEYMQSSLYEALHIQEYEFTEKDRLSVIQQTSSGMAYLHSFPIAHCDMKSSNVLLDFSSPIVAKITDFGLSIMKNNSESSTSEALRNVGTPRYSAPEILRGEFLCIGDMLLADMYSYSLVVYEVLFDAEPFDGYNPHQLRKHVGEGMTVPDIPSSKVNETIQEVMKSCWSRSPVKRLSAADFKSIVKSIDSLYV